MLKLLLASLVICCCLRAQLTPPVGPCRISGSASVGQVPTATGTGTNPPCTWQTGGGGGIPGGSTGTVQYNSSGFAGNDNFVFYPSLSTPSAPTVVTVGTPGVSTYGYKVALVTRTGTSASSTETVIMTGNETLDTDNYNTITAPACPGPPGVTANVYRTTADPMVYDVGYRIANIPCGGSVNDTNIPVDSSKIPPLVDTSTGVALGGTVATNSLFLGSQQTTGFDIGIKGAAMSLGGTFTTPNPSGLAGSGMVVQFNPSTDPGEQFGQSIQVGGTAGNTHAQNVTGLGVFSTYFDGASGSVTGVSNQIALNGTAGSHLTNVYGHYSGILNGDGTATIDALYNYWASGNSTTGSTIGKYYAYYAGPFTASGGTIGERYGLWVGDQSGGTNGYAIWYDGPGNVVTRIKADGIYANYNPSFSPKYTPGGADFEREFIRWDGSNVAEIGTEAGGTGTLRPLRLIGASLAIPGAGAANTVLCWKAGGIIGWASNTAGVIGTTCN